LEIVGNPQGILDLQLRPHPIQLSIITIVILINYIKYRFLDYLKKLRTIPTEGGNDVMTNQSNGDVSLTK
jgi:hypothetical protein